MFLLLVREMDVVEGRGKSEKLAVGKAVARLVSRTPMTLISSRRQPRLCELCHPKGEQEG